MKVSEIRERFLTYYKNNDHNIIESSSLVPSNDETLLFTNSGMVQFKDIFLGNETRDYKRVTTVQKCLRAGGKHNDLDNVGYTARHHTFFEMMGNFSFGDYFKESAILYAWEFLTKNLEISKDKLLVTVYHSDDEAYNLWKKIAGLRDDKVIRISTADNFWEMGEFGPCGPCTEIFYDHGDHIYGGPPGSKDEDGDRFIEIWNLVFMQYEKLKNKEMILLANPSIDTGMGLERIASILQNKNDNYDIDIFQNIMKYTSDIYKTKINESNKVAFKVIADHLRAISFMIADGILPSNEGRGYVLRRIVRRAIRYSYVLGAKEPILHKLFPVIKQEMGGSYPELKLREDFIVNTINQEELKFVDTFENGIKILNKEIELHSKDNSFSGAVAFKLYDTYGFPRDLTEDILRNHSISLNNEEFEESFNKHRELAKKSWKGSGEVKEDKIWNLLAEKIGATKFVGYDKLKHETKVEFLLKESEGTLVFVEKIGENEEGYAVFNETPFYAELGGQVADIGEVHTKDSIAEVLDVQKKCGNVFYHKIRVRNGEIKAQEESKLVVDKKQRKDTSRNHSATHLLSKALNDILGNHVTQQGSMVNSKRLRLDVSYSKALINGEIEAIEARVNQMVLENHPVIIKNMTFNEAIEQGAVPLFSEKYPEIVRTVRIGDKNSIIEDFELCGGTHVSNTGEIGTFKIVSEGSISSGVRRIEALCGRNFLEESTSLSLQAKQLAKVLNTDQKGILSKVESLVKENLNLKKEVSSTIVKMIISSLIGKKERLSNGNCLIYQEVKNIEANKLRDVATILLNTEEKLLVILFVDSGKKASFIMGVSKNLSLDVDFKTLIKKFQEVTQGTGGGSNTVFQGVAVGENIRKAETVIKNSVL